MTRLVGWGGAFVVSIGLWLLLIVATSPAHAIALVICVAGLYGLVCVVLDDRDRTDRIGGRL